MKNLNFTHTCFSQNKCFSFRFTISLKVLTLALFFLQILFKLYYLNSQKNEDIDYAIYMLQQNIYRFHERKKEIYWIALFHFRVRNHLARSIVTRIIKLRYIFLCRADRENVACTVKWGLHFPRLLVNWNWPGIESLFDFIEWNIQHSFLCSLEIGLACCKRNISNSLWAFLFISIMKILKADIEYILKSTHISRSEMFENKRKSIFGWQQGRFLQT